MPPVIKSEDFKKILDYLNKVKPEYGSLRLFHLIKNYLKDPNITPELFSQIINKTYLIKDIKNHEHETEGDTVGEKIKYFTKKNMENGFKFLEKEIEQYAKIVQRHLQGNTVEAERDLKVFTLIVPFFLSGSIFWKLCIEGIDESRSNIELSITNYQSILYQIAEKNSKKRAWVDLFLLQLLTALKTINDIIIPYKQQEKSESALIPFNLVNLLDPLISILSAYPETSKTYDLAYKIINNYILRFIYEKTTIENYNSFEESKFNFMIETYQIKPSTAKQILEKKILPHIDDVSKDFDHPDELIKMLKRFSQCVEFLIWMSHPGEPLHPSFDICVDILNTILNYWGFYFIKNLGRCYYRKIFEIVPYLEPGDRKEVMKKLYSYHEHSILSTIPRKQPENPIRGNETMSLSKSITEALSAQNSELSHDINKFHDEMKERLDRLRSSLNHMQLPKPQLNIRDELQSFFFPPEDPLMDYFDTHPPSEVSEPFFVLK